MPQEEGVWKEGALFLLTGSGGNRGREGTVKGWKAAVGSTVFLLRSIALRSEPVILKMALWCGPGGSGALRQRDVSPKYKSVSTGLSAYQPSGKSVQAVHFRLLP